MRKKYFLPVLSSGSGQEETAILSGVYDLIIDH